MEVIERDKKCHQQQDDHGEDWNASGQGILTTKVLQEHVRRSGSLCLHKIKAN